MPSEPLDRGRGRLATGIFAFLVTVIVAGVAAMVITTSYRGRVEESARRDALLIGNSVAQSLAQQFEKAARFGIPLKLLPGVESHLAETLAATPGTTQIILRDADGRELRSAVGDAPAKDFTSAPVLVDGRAVASVEVATNPVELSDAFAHLGLKVSIAVFVCAVLAALAAGLTVGDALDDSRKRLAERLDRIIYGDYSEGPAGARRGARSGAVGRAFRAIIRGNRHVRERRSVFEAYAEELLAVDFDGTLRPDVERVRHEVLSPADADDAQRGE